MYIHKNNDWINNYVLSFYMTTYMYVSTCVFSVIALGLRDRSSEKDLVVVSTTDGFSRMSI